MSTKPYVVQEDSPNLVIVPTGTYYEPPPKKVKPENGLEKLPTPTKNESVFTKKTSAKSNFINRSVNNDVLIDVRKLNRQPASWASNFLQSISGSSAKFARVYPPTSKLALVRKENTAPENNKEVTSSYKTENSYQPKTITETTLPMMEKEKRKINLNLIQNKPTLLSTTTKDASQPNNTKTSQSKSDTSKNQAQIRNEPSLPKGYKIPINKHAITSSVDVKTAHSINNTYQLNNNGLETQSISSSKNYKSTIPPTYNKPPIQDVITNKETIQPKSIKKTNHLSINKPETNQDIPIVSNKNNKLKYVKETDQLKTKSISSSNKKYIIKPKYDEDIIPSKPDKEIAPPNKNKDTNHLLKYDKETKQRKNTKEIDLPRSYKIASPPEYNKEVTSNKESHYRNMIDTYKIKNKKDTTYSTKLKTKKCNVVSKVTKHSQESDPKKHKDPAKSHKRSNLPETSKIPVQISRKKSLKALLKNESTAKLIKKKISEKKTRVESKNKKSIETKINVISKERSKSFNEERPSKSISPMKSVVTKLKSDHNVQNTEKLYHKEPDCHSHIEKKSDTDHINYHSHRYKSDHLHRDSDIDLRTKLKRKINKNDNQKEAHKWDLGNKRNKFSTVPNGNRFVPDENLIISFDAKDDSDEKVVERKLPVKKMARKQSSGGKKCKKIKLEINIVFDHADTSEEESTKSEDDVNDDSKENADFSFLDDFNVDEIVKTLNECNDSPRKTSNEIHLTNNDVKDENILTSNNKKMATETVVNSQCNALMSDNKTRTKTICNKISSAENNINNSEEMEIQSPIIENRSYSHEGVESEFDPDIGPVKETEQAVDIQCLAAIDNMIVKKEVDMNESIDIEGNTNLLQNKNSTCIQGRITPGILAINSNSEQLQSMRQEVDAQRSIDIEIKTELLQAENSQDNKVLIANEVSVVEKSSSNDCDYKNTTPVVIPHDNILDKHAAGSDFNKSPLNNNTERMVKMHIDSNSKMYTEIDNTIDKTEVTTTESEMTTINNPTETSTNTRLDSDVIIIDDSDGENETGGKLDELTITDPTTSENSESVIILDTDRNIDDESSDHTTKESKVFEQNNQDRILENRKNDTKNSEIDTNNKAELDKAALDDTLIDVKIKDAETVPRREKSTTDSKAEINNDISFESKKTSIESKTGASDKINSEIKPSEKEHGNDEKVDISNAAKLDNKVDSKTSEELTNAKPAETVSTVALKNDKLNTALNNTKPQNVNTKLEVKAQKEDTLQANSENKDKVTKDDNAKSSIEVGRNVGNKVFVQKLEAKLLFFTRRKHAITKLLHVGKFSKIFTCKDPCLSDFAVKVLKHQANGSYKQNMMMKLQNGVPEHNLNCVRLIRGFMLGGLWCFLMEYYPRNLWEALAENNRSFHIDVVQSLSRQLVSAVTILRNNNIIHSDIKPSHILINASNTRIKLCGFDQAAYFDGSLMLPNTGTVNYRAPELILGHPTGYGIDVWSTALVMFEMATNQKLFPGIFNNDILYKHLCTVGSVPMEMLMHCQYRNAHFRGTSFTRIINGSGEKIVMNEIRGNDKLNNILFQTYANDWGDRRGPAKAADKTKLCAFSKLLHSMLVMYPKYRIAIEFVFANPFIYESFDDC